MGNDKAKINASVGVGPFRFYTDFSPWAPVIGLLIGALILAFFWFQYRISPFYDNDNPAPTPTPAVTTATYLSS